MGDIDLSSWVDVATVVGGFATALAAAFAVVGIPLAIAQIRSARAIQREATAKTLYRQYLGDAIAYPELVHPDYAEIRRRGDAVRYELFVAHMLFSLEEVLTNARLEDWEGVVRGQLRRHADYLASPDFAAKKPYYDARLVKLIDEVAGQGPAGGPAPI